MAKVFLCIFIITVSGILLSCRENDRSHGQRGLTYYDSTPKAYIIPTEKLSSIHSPVSGKWDGIYLDENNRVVRMQFELDNHQSALSGKYKAWIPLEGLPMPVLEGSLSGRVNGDTLTFRITDSRDSMLNIRIEGSWAIERTAWGPSQVMFGMIWMPPGSDRFIGGRWSANLIKYGEGH